MAPVDTASNLHPFHRRHKNAILLITLLSLILLSPLIQIFHGSKLLDMVLTSLVMAASINAISYRKRSTLLIAIGLAALAVISGWTQAFDNNGQHENHPIYLILSHSFGAILYTYIAALLFKVILIEDEITIDQIFAGVVIYIFIGLIWAHFYGMTEVFLPDSITNTDGSDPNFVYFSFVTLTTLGYGDMLPVTRMAKSLVIIEAITGVMFVAILVSTLVGRVNMRR